MNNKVIRGVILMAAAMLVIPMADGFGKALSANYSPLYISWARYVVASIVILPIAFFSVGTRIFPSERLGSHFLRTIFLMASMTFFFVSISMIPLPTATASYFVAPFIAAILAVLVLGEKFNRIKLAALVLGSVGALTILRPTSGLEAGVVFAMAAGGLFALYMIATRVASASSHPVRTLVFQCVVGALVLTPQAIWKWSIPLAEHWPLFLGLGAVSIVSHFLSIAAFRYAEASTLAPLVYLELVSSAAIGFVIFGDVPAIHVWIGATVIVAGGLVLLRDKSSNS